MAASSRLCLICGQVYSSDDERREHMAEAHPGQRVAWHGKRPWIVDADGTETIIGASALKRMRGTARKVSGGTPTPRTRLAHVSRRAAPAPEPPMVETPTGDPDAPPYFVQAQPPHFDAGGAHVGPTPTGPAGEAVPEAPTAAVSRETLRLALDQPTLAEMIRNLSMVLSDWDGAGEAGHLSRIEAGQLAMLLHDPTLDLVQRYFGGNINRFRLALAAVVLLLGKGRVHARAIAAKRAAAEAASAAQTADDAAYAATVPAPVVEVDAPEPGSGDPLAELARRQREWNTTPRGEG